jgi:hypothetical protein
MVHTEKYQFKLNKTQVSIEPTCTVSSPPPSLDTHKSHATPPTTTSAVLDTGASSHYMKMIDTPCSNITSDLQLASLQDLVSQYRAVGESILECVTFVKLNVMAVHNILKKHDKNAPLKLLNEYLSTSLLIGEDHDKLLHLHQLYH